MRKTFWYKHFIEQNKNIPLNILREDLKEINDYIRQGYTYRHECLMFWSDKDIGTKKMIIEEANANSMLLGENRAYFMF